MDQQLDSICNKEEALLRAEDMLQRICESDCRELLCRHRADSTPKRVTIARKGAFTLELRYKEGLSVRTHGSSKEISVENAIADFTELRIQPGLQALFECIDAKLRAEWLRLEEAIERNSRFLRLLSELREESND